MRGFIDAAASSVPEHPVAKEYLTPEAAAHVVRRRRHHDHRARLRDGRPPSRVGVVTADLVGTVDQRGVFTVGRHRALHPLRSPLAEVEGSGGSATRPDGLIILEPDFERLYDQRRRLLPRPDPPALVPDPRYLIGGEAQPTALVERLVAGPSAALAAGVSNPLAGARLAARSPSRARRDGGPHRAGRRPDHPVARAERAAGVDA